MRPRSHVPNSGIFDDDEPQATSCRSVPDASGVDTEAVFSMCDPLPGMYELVLLPYLLFKRGL